MIGTERGYALPTGRQIVIESRKHRAMLDDRLIRKGTTIGAGGFRSLPLRIGRFRIREPLVGAHKVDILNLPIVNLTRSWRFANICTQKSRLEVLS
ncbi:hypothetical protein [Caballeronia sp. GaOx3]|uniref:hypothetical protein n=1 Tax=Caballeronia sp. GaOx3 TaxID=2921740 RepID=UPI0020283D09|nr:hypothetical protein [Caballeronia sp. GaOx3]